MDYKIIKHCRLCNKRFVVARGDAKKNYCDECEPKIARKYNYAEGKK